MNLKARVARLEEEVRPGACRVCSGRYLWPIEEGQTGDADRRGEPDPEVLRAIVLDPEALALAHRLQIALAGERGRGGVCQPDALPGEEGRR